jgi:hypothetical protein
VEVAAGQGKEQQICEANLHSRCPNSLEFGPATADFEKNIFQNNLFF